MGSRVSNNFELFILTSRMEFAFLMNAEAQQLNDIDIKNAIAMAAENETRARQPERKR